MHNPFFEDPSQLRREWKALRNELTADLSDEQHLQRVASWWANAPISKRWLDWDRPGIWPDPWELIATKDFDNSAIALGMEYTLLLSIDGRWNQDRVNLWLVSDGKRTMQGLVMVADNRWVLNLEHGRVIGLTEDLTVHARYNYTNRSHVLT